MVERVEAFKDMQGGLHSTPLEAAKVDTRSALESLWQTTQLGNASSCEAWCNLIIEHAHALHGALSPLVTSHEWKVRA